MYIDTKDGPKQMGYVLTASADFRDDDNYKWVKQYINLWVDISIVTSAF